MVELLETNLTTGLHWVMVEEKRCHLHAFMQACYPCTGEQNLRAKASCWFCQCRAGCCRSSLLVAEHIWVLQGAPRMVGCRTKPVLGGCPQLGAAQAGLVSCRLLGTARSKGVVGLQTAVLESGSVQMLRIWIWPVTRRSRQCCNVLWQLGSCWKRRWGIGEIRLPQKGMVSRSLTVRQFSGWDFRNACSPVAGSTLELDFVSDSIITALTNSACVKETSQIIRELFDRRELTFEPGSCQAESRSCCQV